MRLYKATATIEVYYLVDEKDESGARRLGEEALGKEIASNGISPFVTHGSNVSVYPVEPGHVPPAHWRNAIVWGEQDDDIMLERAIRDYTR